MITAIPPHGLFITGTDTGVGKTLVTAALARAWLARRIRVGIYKPVCTGSEQGPAGPLWQDVEIHHRTLAGQFPRERICPQCFDAPLAPPVAARAEGRRVDQQLLRTGAGWWTGQCDWLLVEGVGGFLCPLTDAGTIADFAAELQYPVLIVARTGLGTLNHTLLTIEAIRRRNLPIAGVVLNQCDDEADASRSTNAAEIAQRGGWPVLLEIPYQQQQDLPGPPASPTMDLSGVMPAVLAAMDGKSQTLHEANAWNRST